MERANTQSKTIPSPIRVAMVGPFALDPMGTVRVRMVPIAESLKSAGYDPRIILPPYDNPKHSGRSIEMKSVPIYNIKLSRIPILKHIIVSLRLTLKTFSLHPSIVHVFKPKGYSGVVAMIHITLKRLYLTRVPLVIDTDDLEGISGYGSFYRTNRTRSLMMVLFFNLQERFIVRNADQLTVASRGLFDISSGDFGLDSRKIYYLPNGAEKDLDNDDYSQQCIVAPEDSKSVLLYTRFREFSVDRLIKILRRVADSIPSIRLVVVGKGSFGEENRLVSLAKECGLKDAISIIGWVNPDSLKKVLGTGEIAIYPFDDTVINRTKCPGKLVELLSMGKPVVAEDVGQVREYIRNGETGLIVPSGNNDEFARKIILLLHDKELRERLGSSARDDIMKRFDWSELSKVVETCYSKAFERSQQ
jgi:glycosyltransferase involved in cell wall biosynthesis